MSATHSLEIPDEPSKGGGSHANYRQHSPVLCEIESGGEERGQMYHQCVPNVSPNVD